MMMVVIAVEGEMNGSERKKDTVDGGSLAVVIRWYTVDYSNVVIIYYCSLVNSEWVSEGDK